MKDLNEGYRGAVYGLFVQGRENWTLFLEFVRYGRKTKYMALQQSDFYYFNTKLVPYSDPHCYLD